VSTRSTVLARGRLAGDGVVVVEDAAEASRLLGKSAVGTPTSGGALELTLVEAAWSLAEGRLAVHEGKAALDLAALLARGTGGGHRAESDYLCYRDLRERGLVARPVAPGRFAVWPRGTGAGEPAFHVRACSDADGLAVTDLLDAAAAGDVLCAVDGDGAVTHYQVRLAAPEGDVPEGDLPRAKGTVLADRVLVSDPDAAKAYRQREFLGTPHGGSLLLSFIEAEALRKRGVLSVPPGLPARSAEGPLLLPVHLVLRASGVVPKSGFRFGTHLRAYRGDPDLGHAEWLIHCADAGEVLPWSALSRGVRLAHGVRKTFLVAIPTPDGPAFAALSWFRP
jgi:tRNA-intron endonuclease, archaea type